TASSTAHQPFMTGRPIQPYNDAVKSSGWWGTILVLLALSFVAFAGPANADPTLVDAGRAPVLVANMRSGSITIRTWGRPQIQVETDGQMHWQQVPPAEVQRRFPAQIPLVSQTLQTPDGPITLPPERFVAPPLPYGPHSGVVVSGYGNTIVMIPRDTVMAIARVGRGFVAIDGYQHGFFVAAVHTGHVQLNGVSGTGAVQVLNGPIFAVNSNFARLRARTARGNLIFEGCNALQIEATSVLGSIAYDNGTFEPGLAHFESQRGNVALGIASGGVQIGAHSASGHVYSDLGNGENVQRSANDARAIVNGGGPVVTATSSTGAVILYHGSIRQHPRLLQHLPKFWSALLHRPPARRPPFIRRRRPPR
ncbi:MAG: DUF4097 family beta strand repeat-containing protein, partial [Vulcanimicrobiaceae bacterium]